MSVCARVCVCVCVCVCLCVCVCVCVMCVVCARAPTCVYLIACGPCSPAPAGLVLDKSHSNKDWRQRPLPQEMIDYAITDTEHLHVLRQ